MDPSATSIYFEDILCLPAPPREAILDDPFEYPLMRTEEIANEVLDADEYLHGEGCEEQLPPAPKQSTDEGLSAKEVKTINAMLDVTSRVFSNRRYIATQYRTSNFEQLGLDVDELAEEEADAHNTIRTTVHENLETFISAKREMDEVYENDGELFTGEATEQLYDDYVAMVDAVKTRETPLGKAGASIVNMIRVRSVFEKAQDFLTVPAVLYATCGAEVLPPLPDEVLTAVGRIKGGASGGGGAGGGGRRGGGGDTDDDDDDGSDGFSDMLDEDDDADDDDDDEDGGVSRLIAKYIPRDTFVFRNVLLKPIDLDGNAAIPQEAGQVDAPDNKAPSPANANNNSTAAAAATAGSSKASTNATLAEDPSTARGTAKAATPAHFLALAQERNFENAVIQIKRCLLFLEDNYDLMSGLPKRLHKQSDGVPSAANAATGSPLSPSASMGIVGGVASVEAAARRKREARQEAKRRKAMAALGGGGGLAGSGNGGGLSSKKFSAARLSSLRTGSSGGLTGGGGGGGPNNSTTDDDDSDEDDSDDEDEKEISDTELDAIIHLGESSNDIGGIPKSALSAGDTPLPDEVEHMKALSAERNSRLSLYIAEKQFIFRFVTALLTGSVFLSECIHEELSRCSADSDTIIIEDSIRNLLNVSTFIVKLRHFAIQLRYRLRIAQPVKSKLGAQLEALRAKADGGASSYGGDDTESMMSRSDFYGRNGDDDDDDRYSAYSGRGRNSSIGSRRSLRRRDLDDDDDAVSSAPSTVYDAEGNEVRNARGGGGGRSLFTSFGGGGGGRRGNGGFKQGFNSAAAHTNTDLVSRLTHVADVMLGPSPTAFLKWRPSARGALRRPMLHPVEAYLSVLQQQHATSVQSACRSVLDASLRVMRRVVGKQVRDKAEMAARRARMMAGGEDENMMMMGDAGTAGGGGINNSSLFGAGDDFKDSIVFGIASAGIMRSVADGGGGGNGIGSPTDGMLLSVDDLSSPESPLLAGGGGANNRRSRGPSAPITADQIRSGCLPSPEAQDALKQLQGSLENFHSTAVMRTLLTPLPSLGVVGVGTTATTAAAAAAAAGGGGNANANNTAAATAASSSYTNNTKNFGIRSNNSVLSVHATVGGTDITPIIAATTNQIAGDEGSAVADRCLRALSEGSESTAFYADDYISQNPPMSLNLLTQLLLSMERTVLNYWCGIGSTAVHKGAFDFSPSPPDVAAAGGGGGGSRRHHRGGGGAGSSGIFTANNSSIFTSAEDVIGSESVPRGGRNDSHDRTALAVMTVTTATSNRTPFKPKRTRDALKKDPFEVVDIDAMVETLQLHDRHLRNIAQWLSDSARLMVYPAKDRVRLLSQGNRLRTLREAAAASQQLSMRGGGGGNSPSPTTPSLSVTTAINTTAAAAEDPMDTIELLLKLLPSPNTDLASDTHRIIPTCRFVPVSNLPQLLVAARTAQLSRQGADGDDDDGVAASLAAAAAAAREEDSAASAFSLRARSVATIRAIIRHNADACIQILRATIGHSIAVGLLSSGGDGSGGDMSQERRTVLLELFLTLWERMVLRICDSIIRLKTSLLYPPPTTTTATAAAGDATATATAPATNRSEQPNTSLASLPSLGSSSKQQQQPSSSASAIAPQDAEDVLLFISDLEDMRQRILGVYMVGLAVAARAHVSAVGLSMCGVTASSSSASHGESTVGGAGANGGAYAVDDHFNPMTGSFRATGGNSSMRGGGGGGNATMGATARNGAPIKSATYGGSYGTSAAGGAGGGKSVGALGSQESQQQQSKADVVLNDRSLTLLCRLSRTWASTEFPVILQNMMYVLGERTFDIILRCYEVQSKQRNVFTGGVPPLVSSSATSSSAAAGGGGASSFIPFVNNASILSTVGSGASSIAGGGIVGGYTTAAMTVGNEALTNFSAHAAIDPTIALHRALEALNTKSIARAKDAFSAVIVDLFLAGVDAVVEVGRCCGAGDSPLLSVGGIANAAANGGAIPLHLTAAAATLNVQGLAPEEVLLLRNVRRQQQRHRRLMLSECIADLFCIQRAVYPIVVEKLLLGELWKGCSRLVLQNGAANKGEHDVKAVIESCVSDFNRRGGCDPTLAMEMLLAVGGGGGDGDGDDTGPLGGASTRGARRGSSGKGAFLLDTAALGVFSPISDASPWSDSSNHGIAADSLMPSTTTTRTLLSPSLIVGGVVELALSTLVDQYVSVARSDIALEVQLHGFGHPNFDWQRHYFGFTRDGRISGGGSSSGSASSSVALPTSMSSSSATAGVRSFITDALTHVARSHESIFRIQCSSGGADQSSYSGGGGGGRSGRGGGGGGAASSSTVAGIGPATSSAADGGLSPSAIVGLTCLQVVQRLVAYIGKSIMGVLSAVGGGDTGGTIGFEMGNPISVITNASAASGKSSSPQLNATVSLSFELFGLVVIEAELLFIHSLLDRLRAATARMVGEPNPNSPSLVANGHLHPELTLMLGMIPKAVAAIQLRGKQACEYTHNLRRFGGPAAANCLVMNPADRPLRVEALLASVKYTSHYLTEAICGGFGVDGKLTAGASAGGMSRTAAELAHGIHLARAGSAAAASSIADTAANGVGAHHGIAMSRVARAGGGNGAGSLASRLEQQSAARRDLGANAKKELKKESNSNNNNNAADGADGSVTERGSRLSRGTRKGGAEEAPHPSSAADAKKAAKATAAAAEGRPSMTRRAAERAAAKQAAEEAEASAAAAADAPPPPAHPPTASALTRKKRAAVVEPATEGEGGGGDADDGGSSPPPPTVPPKPNASVLSAKPSLDDPSPAATTKQRLSRKAAAAAAAEEALNATADGLVLTSEDKKSSATPALANTADGTTAAPKKKRTATPPPAAEPAAPAKKKAAPKESPAAEAPPPTTATAPPRPKVLSKAATAKAMAPPMPSRGNDGGVAEDADNGDGGAVARKGAKKAMKEEDPLAATATPGAGDGDDGDTLPSPAAGAKPKAKRSTAASPSAVSPGAAADLVVGASDEAAAFRSPASAAGTSPAASPTATADGASAKKVPMKRSVSSSAAAAAASPSAAKKKSVLSPPSPSGGGGGVDSPSAKIVVKSPTSAEVDTGAAPSPVIRRGVRRPTADDGGGDAPLPTAATTTTKTASVAPAARATRARSGSTSRVLAAKAQSAADDAMSSPLSGRIKDLTPSSTPATAGMPVPKKKTRSAAAAAAALMASGIDVDDLK